MSLSSGDTSLESRHRSPNPEALALQARQLQEHFPDLYTYLVKRDRTLKRALARIPSRADIELSSVFDSRAYLARAMRELEPGVCELCDEEVGRD